MCTTILIVCWRVIDARNINEVAALPEPSGQDVMDVLQCAQNGCARSIGSCHRPESCFTHTSQPTSRTGSIHNLRKCLSQQAGRSSQKTHLSTSDISNERNGQGVIQMPQSTTCLTCIADSTDPAGQGWNEIKAVCHTLLRSNVLRKAVSHYHDSARAGLPVPKYFAGN